MRVCARRASGVVIVLVLVLTGTPALAALCGSLCASDSAHHLALSDSSPAVRGQRQEPRLLLREDLGHRLVALLGTETLMGDVVPPAGKLPHKQTRKHNAENARGLRAAAPFGA